MPAEVSSNTPQKNVHQDHSQKLHWEVHEVWGPLKALNGSQTGASMGLKFQGS